MVGKIKEDELYFYLKDHLGSIRAVLYDNKIYSSQDYDAWGYILEGRTYQSEEGKFKFTGKERDEESFYDYFGARYYDARVGRWGQTEPLYNDYLDLSPYCYTLNNPLRFTDPKGNEIDPVGLYTQNVELYNQLVSEIREKTGISLELVNGLWAVKEVVELGSETARGIILDAINSDIKISIFQSNDLTIGSKSILGGTDIYLNPLQINEFTTGVSGGLSPSTNDASMVFMHELMHTKFGGGLKDPPKKSFGKIGAVESKINIIRRELGNIFGKRTSYAAQETSSGIFIPFDKNARDDLKKGDRPREGSKYIEIYTNFK